MPFTVLFRSLPDFIVTKIARGMRQESVFRGPGFSSGFIFQNEGMKNLWGSRGSRIRPRRKGERKILKTVAQENN